MDRVEKRLRQRETRDKYESLLTKMQNVSS